MKKTIIFLLLLNSLYGNTQAIEETAKDFWKATTSKNNPIIVEKGEQLILYAEKNNIEIDSTIISIRFFTAHGYSNMDKHTQSLELNLKTLEIIENVFGKENPWYAFDLHYLAENYSDLGDYNKSLEYNLLALKIREKIYGKEHVDYAWSLNNLALNNFYLGEYSKSIEINEQCLISFEKLFGKEHHSYATCLNNLALNYSSLGEYNKALEYNLLALKIIEKVLGRENHLYATCLNNLAFNYSFLGEYNKALEYNLLVLKTTEKAVGKEHTNYALSLMNLSLNYLFLGEYSKSKELNEQSLSIYEKVFGKEHPDYANTLIYLAKSYSLLGEYSKSKELNEQCLSIYEKLFGKEHPSYANTLDNLALDYTNLGEYNKALENILLALKIKEKVLGKEHPDYAISLNNIARNYSDLGDNKKALEYNLLALKIREKILGKEHPVYAISLNNLARDYSNLGDFNKALEYNLLALKIIEKVLGKEHPDYAITLNNLALHYSNLGDFNKALEYNLLALEIHEKVFGKEHRSYAVSLGNLAFNYSDLGEYKKALEYNLLALEIKEKAVGKEHPDYATSLNNLALNYCYLRDYNKSLEFFTQSIEISIHSFTKNKFGLTPSIKSSFKQTLELSIQQLASLSCIQSSKISTLHNNWINVNGIIGYDQDQLRRRIELSNNQVIIALFNELTKTQFQLSKYNELTLGARKEKESQIIYLEKKITELQLKLNNYSIGFSELNRTFSSRDVVQNLKDKEVLVDIMRFPYYDFRVNDWTDSIKYLVFISNSQTATADYVYIHKGNELEKLIYNEFKNQASKFEYKTELKDSNFYNNFWKPIADKIGDAKTIYVSLGGIYNNINLNTIYNPNTGKYLLEEKDIRIVNSARDFVLSKEHEKKIVTSTKASLYGFPDFNGNTIISVDTLAFLASTRNLSQEWIDRLTRGNMKASPLPATKIEIENISSTFNKNGWNVSSYSGYEASETNLKKEKSPRVLHIATHGYFFEDIPLDTISNRFFGMDRNQMIQNPMLRSGLLLTGANKTLKGETTTGENGLLSAAEASLLDLRETELVVLSACETGKGEVKNSEGVYGLRKAFSDAGAQNIIMSLWKVDDEVTQEFMTLFYEIWLNKKTSIREAFNKTQLEIKAKYPQPYYWGAFILVGK